MYLPIRVLCEKQDRTNIRFVYVLTPKNRPKLNWSNKALLENVTNL